MKPMGWLQPVSMILFLSVCSIGLIPADSHRAASLPKFVPVAEAHADAASAYDVRGFGALGDGKTLDTPGFYIRHVKDLEISDVQVGYAKPDLRPAFALSDVRGADFQHVKAQHGLDVPTFVLSDVEDFTTHQCGLLPDKHMERIKKDKL